jgi:hypothetical protein
VHFVSSGSLHMKNCVSKGAPAGKGMYFVVVATGGAKEVVLDNSGVQNGWIFHGNEAAIRIMGGCQKATIINLDLCARMHDMSDHGVDEADKTKLLGVPTISANGLITHPAALGHNNIDWWKQVVQWRDVKEARWQGGRCIGRWDVGSQASPLTPQRVGHLVVEGVGLTDEPHFTDPKSYGKVERIDCYKIDLSGAPIKQGGQLVKWPNQTWNGA